MSIEQQKQKKILPKIESEKQSIRQMDIRALYKVGDVKAKYLSNLGIRTVYDLLHHYPFRYEDRRALRRIKDITRGEKVCTSGQIITFEKRLLKKNKTIIKIKIQDDSSMAELVIFNNPFLYSQLRVGRVVFAYGTAEEEYGLIKMNSPELEFDQRKLKTGVIYPVYPLTRGITNDEMIRWQKESLQILSQSMEEDYINEQYREE